MQEIQQRLAGSEVRLLTLTGPPGVGKTRLALEAAAHLPAAFDNGIIFVDLTPIRDPALVASTIAQSLGVVEWLQRPVLEELADFLQEQHLLLVLDNYEQVLDAADVVDHLLRMCPRIKILVTSRAPLRLTSEHEFPVAPLELPDREHLPSPVEVAASSAVALFVARARAVQPDFALDASTSRAVADICVRLDGLPLAIELAAARVKHLPPVAIVARLEDRFALLTSGARNVPARHQTLHAAIAWSYDLLEPSDQALFRRLAVFVGGCTLEAAGAVCPDGHDRQRDILDGLAALVDRSLLSLTPTQDGTPRFRMLESLREFALGQLAESDEAGEMQRRHAGFFLRLAERAKSGLLGPEAQRWLEHFDVEDDNLRAALAWTLGGGDPETGVKLAGALSPFWYSRGHLSEGRAWLDRALAHTRGVPVAARCQLLGDATWLARFQGDYKRSVALAEEAMVLAREAGQPEAAIGGMVSLGHIVLEQGDDTRAKAIFEEGLSLARAAGNEQDIVHMLSGLAVVARDQGDYDRATALFEETVDLLRKAGNQGSMANQLAHLSLTALYQGDHGRAETLGQEALALLRQLNIRPGIAFVLTVLGFLALVKGDDARAWELHREALVLRSDVHREWGSVSLLESLALVAARHHEEERAARVLGAAEAWRIALGLAPPGLLADMRDKALSAMRGRLGKEGMAAAWEVGRRLPLEQAVKEALAVRVPPRPDEGRQRPGQLSPREQEVAVLVSHGRSNREIAAALYISERTVESHVQSILNKLGFHTRTQIATWAAAGGQKHNPK